MSKYRKSNAVSNIAEHVAGKSADHVIATAKQFAAQSAHLARLAAHLMRAGKRMKRAEKPE